MASPTELAALASGKPATLTRTTPQVWLVLPLVRPRRKHRPRTLHLQEPLQLAFFLHCLFGPRGPGPAATLGSYGVATRSVAIYPCFFPPLIAAPPRARAALQPE